MLGVKGKDMPPFLKHGLDILIEPFWYHGDMLEGKCPKCGTYRIGWALVNPRHQTCPKCGTGLEITEDGRKVMKGYSPFTAEESLIKPPASIPHSRDKDKNKRRG